VSLVPHPRIATVEEAAALWPAVRADRLFDSADQFSAYRDAGQWRVRVANKGEAAVLGVWRSHLDVLAMRGVWCSARHVEAFAEDARQVARELGLAHVLSPLLPVDLLGPYRRSGLELAERVVAMQGHPEGVLAADPPMGVTFRPGEAADLTALAELDAAAFDEFWRYGLAELADYATHERLVVAEAGDGEVIGYTLATMSRGAASLGRLAVAPRARRHGVARALVADVARWATKTGAITVSLCTQEGNAAARRLYAEAGFSEIVDAYGFAMGPTG
jgi:ribosomal-protein-alanine N-acetyltransferase